MKSSNRELDGKVAIVTGSSRNIGRAIAKALAKNGAKVIVSGKTGVKKGLSVVKELQKLGTQAEWFQADISDPTQARALISFAKKRFKRLDIVVNNASARKATPLQKITPEEWRAMLAVTINGTFFVSQAAAQIIKPGGSIVNLGGLGGHVGVVGRIHGSTAKAAVIGMTKALAAELAPKNITVNCVVPGVIDTVRGATAGKLPKGLPMPLFNRLGKPEEIAAMVRFLVGPQARFITGQAIHVNGGAYLP